MKFKVYSLYVTLCIVWGTTWIVLKTSLTDTPVFFAVGVRFLISGAILWGIFFARKEKLPLNKQAIILYTMFAIFNFIFGYAFTYWSMQFIYSNLGAILWATFPLVIAFMAHWSLPAERLTLRKITSILIGLAGVVMIIYDGKDLGTDKALYGIIATLMAVVIAAWPNIHLKKNPNVVNPIQLNVVAQTVAGVALFSLSWLIEANQPMVWSTSNIMALIYLAIFGTVIAWLINIWLFDHISVTQISYIAFFPPLVAAFLGWIILDEQLTPWSILGSFLILSGALMINFKFRRRVLEP